MLRHIQQVHVLTYEKVEAKIGVSDVSVKPSENILRPWALAIQHCNINATQALQTFGVSSKSLILQLSPLFWSNFSLPSSLQTWGVRGNGFNESGTFGPWWIQQATATCHQDFHLSLTGLGYGLGAKERWRRLDEWVGKKPDRICRFFFLLAIMVGDGWKKTGFFVKLGRNMWNIFYL